MEIEFDYRIICSSNSQKNLKLNLIILPIQYLKLISIQQLVFEGVDIWSVGKTIVLSDSI